MDYKGFIIETVDGKYRVATADGKYIEYASLSHAKAFITRRIAFEAVVTKVVAEVRKPLRFVSARRASKLRKRGFAVTLHHKTSRGASVYAWSMKA